MKRFISIVLTAALALFVLCGCGEKPPVDGPSIDPAYDRVRPSQIKSEIDTSAPASGYKLHLDALDENGALLWSYDSPGCVPTELDTLEYWGVYGDLVYINEQGIIPDNTSSTDMGNYAGRLRALDIYTGNVAWDNDQYTGASTVRAYDEATGIIYSCGYYGPDCCAVDQAGSLLWTAANDAGYYWPYEIRLEESWITVTFDGCESNEEATGPFEGSFTYDGEPIMG